MIERPEAISEAHRRHSRSDEACPPSDALAKLAAGKAWPWQRRRLAAHLAECSACADDYRAVRGVRPGIEQALQAYGDATRAPSAMPSWLAGAAGVTAAAVLAIGVLTTGGVGSGGDEAAPASSSGGVLFAGDFEPRREASREDGGDRLFRSDFGEGESSTARNG